MGIKKIIKAFDEYQKSLEKELKERESAFAQLSELEAEWKARLNTVEDRHDKIIAEFEEREKYLNKKIDEQRKIILKLENPKEEFVTGQLSVVEEPMKITDMLLLADKFNAGEIAMLLKEKAGIGNE